MDTVDGIDITSTPQPDNPKCPHRWRWSKDFPVIGKGILFFNIEQKSPFFLIVRPKYDEMVGESWIGLYVGTDCVKFYLKENNKKPKQQCVACKDTFFGDKVGIEPNDKCSYWLSYDSDRMIVKYGKGYCMDKTTILEHQFKKPGVKIDDALFDPSVRRKVQLYDNKHKASDDQVDTYAPPSLLDVEPEVEFDCNPLISDMSPLVMDSSKANLFYLDEGRYLYSSSLPPACQALYGNVTAANIDLDYVPPDFTQYKFLLTAAIRYSIETKGCVLFKKLKAKKGEFGDLSLTYLRITLGKEYGSSPGVPYVLELWPKSHGSPIHNHGNSYAVIRVLHGGLTIHYYNKMKEGITDCCNNPIPDIKQLGQFDVKKRDVTWISPKWYQTHRLQNDTEDYCATIQCYAYGSNDHTHWPYFDYMKTCRRIAEFEPDSDFGFRDMYNKVMKEYQLAHETKNTLKRQFQQKVAHPKKRPRKS